MVDGKDDTVKRHLIAPRIFAQWIVAEQNMIFYHWLYRWGVLELCIQRTTRDQKPQPNQILLCLQQQPAVVWSKEKNLSISMSFNQFHS